MKLFKLLFLAFTMVLFTVNTALSQSTNPAQKSTTKKISTVSVKGVTCSKDVKTLSDNVKKLKGVNSCEVLKSGATSKFKIDFNPVLVSEKQIHATIEDTPGCKNPNDRPYKVKQ